MQKNAGKFKQCLIIYLANFPNHFQMFFFKYWSDSNEFFLFLDNCLLVYSNKRYCWLTYVKFQNHANKLFFFFKLLSAAKIFNLDSRLTIWYRFFLVLNNLFKFLSAAEWLSLHLLHFCTFTKFFLHGCVFVFLSICYLLFKPI